MPLEEQVFMIVDRRDGKRDIRDVRLEDFPYDPMGLMEGVRSFSDESEKPPHFDVYRIEFGEIEASEAYDIFQILKEQIHRLRKEQRDPLSFVRWETEAMTRDIFVTCVASVRLYG